MSLTFGELRQQIARENLGWTVPPHFKDADIIPRVAMGAEPSQILKANPNARLDVHALVRASPPANHLLQADLALRNILPPVIFTNLLRGVAPVAPVAAGAGAPSRPAVVDWRNRFGWNWITAIRDQDPCEHCWVYAPTALIEAMVRIEHCVWSPRSVGDYIEANKTKCGQCGDPRPVLDWAKNNGLCDLDTVPWPDRGENAADRPGAYWNPPPDKCGGGSMVDPAHYGPPSTRAGRTTRVPGYTTLDNIEDQKNWLDAVGPLVVTFDVYEGFQGWSGNTPYKKQANAKFLGSHVVLCVGYDDNLKCWILKNQWGANLGNQGYWLFGYGECSIDSNAKLGLRGVNPDPWTKRRMHAGGMIESGNGATFRNFELVAPSAGNSVSHWWRDNGVGAIPWHKAEQFGNDVADPPTFTGTSFNRNFEMVYRTTGGQLHHRYFDQGPHQWKDGPIFGPAGAHGAVGFCESGWGPGNFEVVVAVGGSMHHWWRDPGFNWAESAVFGSNIATAGPSLLQSTFGSLELVAVNTNGTMQHWWRNGAVWTADQVFGAGISSPPCMIQGQFGMSDDTGNGNFELCVATPAGTIEHWWRTNASPFPWARSATFGSGIARVLALIEGSYGFNLEVVALRQDGTLQHLWRDGTGWHDGVIIGTTH